MRYSLRWTLPFLLFAAALPAAGQTIAPPVKYWVFFNDKPDVASKAVPVSEHAHARRVLRGIPTDPALDRPVDADYLAALGVVPEMTSRWLNAASIRLTPVQRDRIAAMPFVRSVRPVGRMVPQGLRKDPEMAVPVFPSALSLRYGDSWHQLAQIRAIEPLERGINGAGVRLGIIDTWPGSLDHPALRPLINSGRLLAFRDFTGEPDSLSQHGLWILSVAAGYAPGRLIGPAYGADVLFAGSEFGGESETNQEEDHWVEAIEWMESEGVDVVSTSLGYNVFDPGQSDYTYADMDGNTAVTTIAADRAAELGVVVVACAGNEAWCSPPSDSCWYYMLSPADGNHVIAVGGVDAAGNRYRGSSYGPTSDGRIKPDVSARGWGVTTAFESGYSNQGAGTSFAAPLVAGVVAQLLQARPSLTAFEVADILRATASLSTRPNNSLGYGIVNAQAAISMATARELQPLPTAFRVSVWPSPFAAAARIEVEAPTDSGAGRLDIFDMLGRRIATFQTASGPRWHLDIDASAWPSGPLLYRLSAGQSSTSGLLIHLQ